MRTGKSIKHISLRRHGSVGLTTGYSHEVLAIEFLNFALFVLQLRIFCGVRKFFGSRRPSNSDIPPAKHVLSLIEGALRTLSSENYFILFLCGLCAFAGDFPRSGCGCAALGLRDENFFTVIPEESSFYISVFSSASQSQLDLAVVAFRPDDTAAKL